MVLREERGEVTRHLMGTVWIGTTSPSACIVPLDAGGRRDAQAGHHDVTQRAARSSGGVGRSGGQGTHTPVEDPDGTCLPGP